MWLIGEGWLDEYQVFNFDIYEVTGGSMASISNPNNADLSNWGSGLLLPRNASDPACRGFRLFLTPEDETLELDLPSGGNFGTYVYPLEAINDSADWTGQVLRQYVRRKRFNLSLMVSPNLSVISQ